MGRILRKPLGHSAQGLTSTRQSGERKVTISLRHSQEGSASEVEGRHKARGKPQLEHNTEFTAELYPAKHHFSPTLINSLEKAKNSEKEETSRCCL